MSASQRLSSVLATTAALVLAVVATLCVSGCGQPADAVIREGLSRELDAFVSPTVDSLKQAIVDLGGTEEEAEATTKSFADLKAHGIDPDEMLKHLFWGYAYEIGEISVDGDTATAAVTLTSADFPSVVSQFSTYFESDEGKAELQKVYSESGETAMYQAVYAKFYEYIEAAGTTTTSLTLSLEKRDGTWQVTDESTNELIGALFVGLGDLSAAAAGI